MSTNFRSRFDLKTLKEKQSVSASAQQIIRFVSGGMGMTLEDVQRPMIHPSHRPYVYLIMWAAWRGTKLSSSRVGRLFHKSGVTVRYAAKEVEDRREVDPEFLKLSDLIRTMFERSEFGRTLFGEGQGYCQNEPDSEYDTYKEFINRPPSGPRLYTRPSSWPSSPKSKS